MALTRKQPVGYLYDALGRRVQRHLRGSKEITKFIYDGQDVLVDDNSGTLTKYLNGAGIDNKLRVQTGSDVKSFLADHLGSTNALTNSSGAIAEQTVYDSFGNATANLSTRYQFTGREFDSFTGLHYYRARFYDANLGRFISEDPIGLGGGINLFGYVGNNSTNLIDPSGFDGCKKGRCEQPPQPPTGIGEPPRQPPPFITDPPPPMPSPKPPPRPSPFPTPMPPAPPPPTSPSEPSSPCDCETAIPRFPDFYTLSGNVPLGYGFSWNPSVTIDRHYQIYGTLFGASFPAYSPGGSLNAGWILKRCEPSSKDTSDYLTSFGGGATGYFPPPYPFGGGFGVSSGGAAVLFGAGFPPGISGSFGYGHQLYPW